MSTTTRRTWQFWATPAVALIIGVAYFWASWAGGHPGTGVFMLSVMVVAAVGSVLFALMPGYAVQRVLIDEPPHEVFQAGLRTLLAERLTEKAG